MTNEKIRVYDGKGGFKEVPAGTKVELDKKKLAESQADAAKRDYFTRIDALAKFLNTAAKTFGKENGMTPEEIAGGFYLESCNIRHFFPAANGGTAEYDAVTKNVWEWFKEQLQKS